MWKAIDGTFGERQGFEEMVLLLTPILMNALAVHIALRMKMWNIGSEGQFFMGAWAATGIGIYMGGPRVARADGDGNRRGAGGRGVDPRAGIGAGPLERQRDHHDAAPQLRRDPVGRLVQLRHLA